MKARFIGVQTPAAGWPSATVPGEGSPWRQLRNALRRLAGLRARSIDVQRQTFPYLAGGTGEPLVLVHGFTGDKDMWGVVASYAAKYP